MDASGLFKTSDWTPVWGQQPAPSSNAPNPKPFPAPPPLVTMSRLASLRGPSAPSSPSSRSQPLAAQASALPHTSLASSFSSTPHSPPAKTPLQPASVDPSPQHRKMRAVLVEVERTLRDWEAVVRSDGGKAGKGLIDARTELECVSSLPPSSSFLLLVCLRPEPDA